MADKPNNEENKAPVLESTRSGIKAKMSAASSVITEVSRKLRDDPIYSTYLRFKMNDLEIISTSTDPNQNLLMSFTNKKNGSGYANSFNLRIAYAPNTGEDFDINKIDNALAKGIRDNGYEMSSRYCEIQYGYGDTTDLRTVTYTGLVMDYTSEIQNGMLVYDISGYSGLVLWNESKDPITYDASIAEADGTVKPTLAFKSIVNSYLRSKDKSIIAKPYDIKFDDNVEGSDAPVSLPASLDKNVGKALDDILKKAVLQSDYDKMETDSNSQPSTVYTWFISDEVTDPENYPGGTIWVVMFNKNQIKEADDASIVFNWMSPGGDDEVNHIVIDFKPEFNGSVLLSKAADILNPKVEITAEDGTVSQKQDSDATDQSLYDGSYFMNNKGQLEKCAKTNAPIPGGEKKIVNVNVASHSSNWISELNYPYKASMLTMGIPCEIPITGTIKIIPMIYGQPHFSNGIYMVLGTTDEINNGGGFTTSWELMRTDKVVETESPAQKQKRDEVRKLIEDQRAAADNSTTMTPEEKAGHRAWVDIAAARLNGEL